MKIYNYRECTLDLLMYKISVNHCHRSFRKEFFITSIYNIKQQLVLFIINYAL